MAYHKHLRGADLHSPSNELVENNTGSTLTKMKVVSLSGIGTTYPQVILCNPSVNTPIGIIQSDMLTGTYGIISTLGLMYGLDTSAWAIGTHIYSDVNGNLSAIPHQNPVAFVVKSHATTGVLYVTAFATTLSHSGIVNTGSANRLAIYPTTGEGVDDVLIQNAQNIDVIIATQATRTTPLEYTIPNPGDTVAAASFVLTEGTQTINGLKTFNNNVTMNGDLTVLGTTNVILSTNTVIKDALITLNKGGLAASAINTGFEIEENALITGYFKTDAARDSFLIKAPTTFEAELDLALLTTDKKFQFPDVAGTLVVYSQIPVTSVAGKVGAVTLELNDHTDVDIINQALDEVLKWNGTTWTNGVSGQTSAGAGVNYFLSATIDAPSGYDVMSKLPDTGAEVDESVIVNNNTLLIDSYISDTIAGDTVLDAGIWTFNLYSYCSSTLGINTLSVNVYSRTSGGVETFLFTADNGSINTSVIELYKISSVQPPFSVATTDRLVFKFYATTTNTFDTTMHLVHSGTSHYSYVSTPLITHHNDLSNIQGGNGTERYHLTSAQLSVLTSAATINTASTLILRGATGEFSSGKITATALNVSAFTTPGIVKNDLNGDFSGGNSIILTSDVSGILPIANGGTNANNIISARTNLELYSQAEVQSLINGSNLSFFFSDTVSDVGGYFVAESTSGGGIESNVTTVINANPTLIKAFVTAINEPNTNTLKQGIYNVHIHAAKTAGTQIANIYAELYVRSSGGGETLIGTSGSSIPLTGTPVENNLHIVISTDIDILVSDRIVTKIYGVPSGGGSTPTVAIYMEGTTASRIELFITTAAYDTRYFVKGGLNGGQIAYGGQASGENLTFSSTLHATKGQIFFGSLAAYDEVSTKFSIGTLTQTGSFSIVHNKSLASGIDYGLYLTPTYILTGTAGSTDLLINRTETSLGSGAQLFADFQVAGVSKFKVTNTGGVTITGAIVMAGNLSGVTSGTMTSINVTNINTANVNTAMLIANQATTTAINKVSVTPSSTVTTGQFTTFRIAPTYNQVTATTSNTDFLINRTETSIGSGNQYLIDAQVGGVSKFNVDRTGRSLFQGELLSKGLMQPAVTKTGAYTIITTDHTIFADATGGAFTITLPTAASSYDAVNSCGDFYIIKRINTGANVVTVQANGVELIDGANTAPIISQYASITVQSNGTQWFIL